MKFLNTEKQHAAIQPRSAGHSSGNRTRGRLIEEALRLFSEQGIGAVSIRTIVAAAGAQNLSAVHYHFGNKNGLVDAIIEQTAAELLPVQEASLAVLKGIKSPTPREIFEHAFVPYLDMAIHSEVGLQQARFLARLTWEEGERGQKILMQEIFGQVIKDVDELLAVALPNKPRHELQLHLTMCMTNVIHGVADRDIMPLIPLPGMVSHYVGDNEKIRAAFFDFLAAGISANT